MRGTGKVGGGARRAHSIGLRVVPPEPREQWEPLVGRLILLCGDIELRILQLHWNLSLGAAHDQNLKTDGLRKKAKATLKVLEKKTLQPQLKEKVDWILNETLKLADARNLVAHNPLRMGVYANDKGNFTLIPHIRSPRASEELMSFEKLAGVVNKAKQLEAELMSIVIEVGVAVCNQA